jgi:hypothetical protein
MRQLSYPVCGLLSAATLRSARLAGFALLSMLTLGASYANALPRPASGSNCKPDWVNNQGAMACFIQGEEEARNGVSNPHYVACLPNGEVVCCKDNDHGGQNCEGVEAGARPASENAKFGAILQAQQTILTKLNRLSIKLDNLERKLGELKRKSSAAP